MSTATQPAPRRLAPPEAAEYLGISLTSLYRLLAQGRLEYYRVLAGRTVIDRVELDRYMEERRVPRTPDGRRPPRCGARRGRPRKVQPPEQV